jgi:hypothetical protein
MSAGAIEAISDLEECCSGCSWHGTAINRFRLRAGSILASCSLRSHLISDVDRPQERLVVICKDECASRVAITRGLLVRS